MKKKKKKWPIWVKIILSFFLVVTGLVVILTSTVAVKWKKADYLSADMFKSPQNMEIPVLKVSKLNDDSVEAGDEYIEGDVISYNGKRYRYNDNLINILILGVDDKGLHDDDAYTVPYQTDTIVLGTIDVIKKEVHFLNIPRDTVTSIQVLDFNDEVATTEMGPIAIQHSYGNQGEKTDEVTVQTVSNLLYGVPIYRYATVKMTAIPAVNDSVGGVTVEVLEDLTKWNSDFSIGNIVTLHGDDAIIYTCRRDVNIDDSSIGRMKRQAQYITKLFPAVKNKTMDDITFPVTLYNELSDKINTNLSIDEITYLAKQLMDLSLNTDSIETVPGQMREIEEGEIEGYNYKMGYIVDEDSLKQLIIDRYYEPVK